MARMRADELSRQAAERGQREFTIDALQRMIRMDLQEATNLGLITREEAADEAIRAVLNWKSTNPRQTAQ